MTQTQIQTKTTPETTKETTDSVSKQIQETRLLLEKINHRSFLKNQLILKAPF